MKKTSKISILKKMITNDEQRIKEEGVKHEAETKSLQDKFDVEIMMKQ